ncbi:transporter substrate-binding domain-containing protein [Aliiglaciecola sp. CAU 1673]|uniref:substrate-binding periplasmic protein n=1 Tax=Aliiglaciecola sp. CAU 1673 TaxID=3032595 RepID=UPI0023DA2DEF|nr:transporter substrate-binding domain-containing protein [Aliiglaciecola sp. CAU 1673]MDF2177681.1 transporter substrate-binding domain-containing protein [Aliiglaciecola sp. CAU 1673]
MLRTLCGFLFTFIVSVASADTVYLTSLSWPPYSDKDLKEQGASVAVAKAAFKAMGHELVVEFYPWSRAMKLASDPGSKYMGYFPEYSYESEEFSFSTPMGQGPLGLVESADKPITWNTTADLANYKLGVVQDYVNTEELDALIAAGTIKAQAVVSDDKNVQKVAAKRIDAAVIDANVLQYLLDNDKSLADAKGKVQMNVKLLVNKDLHVAFKNTEDGKKWLDIFNQGLSKIDVSAIMAEYLK